MRPTKLEVQGLTAYKDRTELDFSGLDLFAITGPTGSGKTTLVDAITYALFGQIPRVGNDVKQLISQNEERLRVGLEFTSDGHKYRIHRSTGKGLPAVQLERFDEETSEWTPEADKVKDVNEYVERVLGMDYDGFVRSVLLPQGQFQQFLAGRPEERRKVLDGLLRLDTYDQMQRRANQIGAEHAATAEGLNQQLQTQHAGATPEALAAARGLLKDLERTTADLAALRAALSEAAKTAEVLAETVRKGEAAEKAAVAACASLDEAQKLVASGEDSLGALRQALVVLEVQSEANRYDAERLLRLSQALEVVQRVERAEKRLAQMIGEAETAAPRLANLRTRATEADRAADDARKALEEADAHLQDARREDQAASVRHGLKAGDSCPVCGQKITSLPPTQHAGIAAADATLKEARALESRARQAAQALRTEVAVAVQHSESLVGQVSELQADCASDQARVAELLAGEAATAAEIADDVRLQTAARRDRERIATEERDTRAKLDALAAELAAAVQNIARLRIEIELQGREARIAASGAQAARDQLAKAATERDWLDAIADMEAGRDTGPALRKRLDGTDGQLAAANQEIGSCRGEIARIEDGIEKAKEMREVMDRAREAAALARDLAALLRVTAFPNYIRERALKVLAQDGSRQLLEISSGRYEFQVEGQEFLVSDRWNSSETRSVKTLSGGETFLASLALALALAERLPGLGAGRHAGALESLFIDEGFSNLDVSALDDVVTALEGIGKDGSRMVGIVTHLEELAERMPARIRVHKSEAESRSRVTIE